MQANGGNSQTSPDAGCALSRLFVDHAAEVKQYVRRRCGSSALAEDIASQTFEQAARRLRDDPSAELAAGWLLTVAKRRLVDHWRRAERERALTERIGSVLHLGPSEIGDAAGATQAIVDRLSDRYRKALVVRYVDELPVGDLAEALGVSYSATESLLARARTQVRRLAEAS